MAKELTPAQELVLKEADKLIDTLDDPTTSGFPVSALYKAVKELRAEERPLRVGETFTVRVEEVSEIQYARGTVLKTKLVDEKGRAFFVHQRNGLMD